MGDFRFVVRWRSGEVEGTVRPSQWAAFNDFIDCLTNSGDLQYFEIERVEEKVESGGV